MIFVLIPMISGQTEMFKHIIISLQKVKSQLLFLGAKISGIKGYQIEIATDKKFKMNKKTVKMKKQNRYTQKNNCININ